MSLIDSDPVRASLAGSRLTTWIGGSVTVRYIMAMTTGVSTVSGMIHQSAIYQAGQSVSSAWQTAAFSHFLQKTGSLIRSSFLYHWLTKEPDPEVIVIDLRDTYTVAPLIMALDRLLTALTPAYRRSRLRAVGTWLDGLMAKLLETRLGQMLASALSPPAQVQEPNREAGVDGAENEEAERRMTLNHSRKD